MYRYSNGQISLSDFQQPMGMRLREDNRWVKKAQSIPWDKIEKKYADLFPSETGNVAKPLQLALGACLIQREYGYSDVETVLQIQENPYLQYFCGYAGYDDSKLPFDASSMVHFRKRLTPEVLAQINEMVIQEAQKTEDNDNQDDNKPDGGGNSGTIIVDATCAPSNIRYPQDVSLLNEARENAEKLLDILHSPTDGKKPRTYRKRARKDYLKYVRCRKHTAKMTRKAIGKQLNYLKRDLAAIDGKLNQEKALNIHQTERLETIRKIYEQQKYMYDNHTHSVENRIVSVSQPFVRPIVRGKVGKPVEFGMKLDISVTDGWTRLEYRSFDAYNEATKLQEMIENFHKREGHYPSRVLADKIYRNRENLSYCKARGIRLSGPALGRPKKGEDRNKAQDYRDECERVEVERKFSLGKRKCGMGLVTAKLEETAAHVVALSILLLNLRKIQCAFLQFLDWLLGLLQSREKRMVIQWTLYRDQIVLGGIDSDFGEPISLFEYEAKKKLRIASGEKVVNDLIDSYGDSSIREMYDYVHKYRNTVNEMNRRTASKVQKEAASYVEKSSSTLDKFFADAIKLHMDDISNRYSKEKYDGFVDAEDWATKFAEYPIVIINPKESMKLKRKEEVYH